MVKLDTNEDYIAIKESKLFDAVWYRNNNLDLQQDDIDVVEHYLLFGGKEGRPASVDFHSAGYYYLNTDVALAGLNPLLHYLRAGYGEQRSVMTVGDFIAMFGGDGSDWYLDRAVALVASSELYDPIWFREQYGALSFNGLSPFTSLVERKPSLLLNPGPNFDSQAYLSLNEDVASEGLNPLLHYLQWGSAEGRGTAPVQLPKEEIVANADSNIQASSSELKVPEDVTGEVLDEDSLLDLIKKSPLFDAGWYTAQHADVVRSGGDPLLHYIRYGASEGRRPSVYFDPVFYREQYKDKLGSGENPLAHYLVKGRALGLKPSALLDFTAPSRRLVDVSEENDPLVSVDYRGGSSTAWTRHRNITPSDGYHALVFGGTTLAFVSDVGKLTTLLAPVAALSRLLKADPTTVRIRSTVTGREIAAEPLLSVPYCGLGPALRSGIAVLSDIWSPGEGLLRMRFGKPAESLLPDDAPTVVRAFQADLADPSRVRLVGEGLVSCDPSFLDLVLDNPFAPVLLVVTTTDGVAIDFGLLPFPTLARGAAHGGELLALSKQATTFETFCAMSDGLVSEHLGWNADNPPSEAVASIGVRLDDALGSERVFSVAAREWMLALFGVNVSCEAGNSGDFDVNGGVDDGQAYLLGRLNEQQGLRPALIVRSKTRSAGARLVLPADALPTISILVSRRLDAVAPGTALIGPYIMSRNASSRAMWLVSLPACISNFSNIQPAANSLGYPLIVARDEGECGRIVERIAVPAAVRFPSTIAKNDAVQLMPRAPDATGPILRTPLSETAVSARVSVILLNAQKPVAKKAVEALSRQTGLEISDVIAVTSDEAPACHAELRSLFNGRFIVVSPSGYVGTDLRQAAERASSDAILVLDSASILHDSRTLETLVTLLANDKVASAACGSLREARVRSRVVINTETAGYFPSGVSFSSIPQLAFAQPNVFEALPGATYPVVANDLQCTLIRRELLLQHATEDDADKSDNRLALRFGLWALKHGWYHLCTTGVRTSSIDAKIVQQDLDPVGLSFIESGRWEDVLAKTTLVRELR